MKQKLIIQIIVALLLSSSLFAKDIVSFTPYKKSEFSPARKQSFDIPFVLKEKAKVNVHIYTPDGNLIRTISSNKALANGNNSLTWDGKDNTGIIVPDEAYTVKLEAKNKSNHTKIDPLTYSGGEIETERNTKFLKNGKIIYNLSKPSRVMIRAGLKDGPMMRSLINWIPKAKGKNIQHWNGYDEDKTVNVFKTNNYGILVVAFSLPEYSIITTGNKKLTYAKYFTDKKFTFKPVPKEKRLLERNKKGISPHFYAFRLTDKDPRIGIHFPKNIKKNKDGIPMLKNDKAIPIKVTMPTEDEAFIEESKYEVSFFMDYQFKSEEELGYMPITWLWSPNGFSKGEHILTVNVSGFSGQVGVKNIKFIIY